MQPDKDLLKKFSQNTLNNQIDDDEDSSEDEDYVCENESEIDDDSSGSSSSQASNESSDSDEGDSTINVSDDVEEKKPASSQNGGSKPVKKIKAKKETDSTTPVNGDRNQKPNAPVLEKIKVKEHIICCICLNQQSDSTDELVQCDSCGFYTHEGCYGISDTDSKMTSNSSASTEPWFCNACLAADRNEPRLDPTSGGCGGSGLKCYERACELCPNTECGLLKETENGKFVHSLCALYTPGIAYQDVDKLWPVVLDEIPVGRWGEQICSLCEDIRFSRTGICIQCDAGLCKSYFHVTCAQKFGYLLDPTQAQVQNPNDPFIAYCKLHNEKAYINSRKASFLAMMSSYRSKHQSERRMYEIGPDKERVHSKFLKAQENYELSKTKTLRPGLDRITRPRMLTTCPSAMKKLTQKASLNKENVALNGDEIIDQQTHHSATITFSSEFVKYYFEREIKIRQNFKDFQIQKELQPKLAQEEIELRKKYEKKCEEQKKIADENRQLVSKLQIYANLISLVLPKSEYQHELIDKLLHEKQPSHYNISKLEKKSSETTTTPKGKRGRPSLNKSKSGGSSPHGHKAAAAATAATSDTPRKKKGRSTVPNTAVINTLSISSCCSICKEKTNSHLLVDCDTCKQFFHITCLEPPLSAVPKKTKLFGWECSKCVRKKDNSSEECPSLETSINTLDDKGCMRRMMRRERKPRTLSTAATTSSNERVVQKKGKHKQKQKKQKRSMKSSGGGGDGGDCPGTSAMASASAGVESLSSSGGKRRGRPVKRLQRNDSASMQGSVISASARTTAESVHSTKAVVSADDEPIYIDDDEPDDNHQSLSQLDNGDDEEDDDDDNESQDVRVGGSRSDVESDSSSSSSSSSASVRSNLVMDVSASNSPCPTTSVSTSMGRGCFGSNKRRSRSRSSSPHREQQTVPTTTASLSVNDVIDSVIKGDGKKSDNDETPTTTKKLKS